MLAASTQLLITEHFCSAPKHNADREGTVFAWSEQQSGLNINKTFESVSYCSVLFSFHQPSQLQHNCGWCVFVFVSSSVLVPWTPRRGGGNLKSFWLILSEAFRISTLYHDSICEKRCHTGVCIFISSAAWVKFNFNFINPHGWNWFKRRGASDNKIRDIKTKTCSRRRRLKEGARASNKTMCRPEWHVLCVHGTTFF